MSIYKDGNRCSDLRTEKGVYIAFHGEKAVYCGKSQNLRTRLTAPNHTKIQGCGKILVYYHANPNACEEILLQTFKFRKNMNENTGVEALTYDQILTSQLE